MYLNNLQAIVFAVILSVFILIAACSKKSIIELSANINYIEKFELGEEKLFGSDNNFFKAKFESLEDSRCPINANCVRGGDAIVNLTFEDAKSVKDNVIFKIGESSGYKPDTASLKINNETYRIVLESVLPHPEFGKDITPTATFHFYKL